MCRKNIFSGPETIAKCMWFLIRKFFEKTFFHKNSRKFVEFAENGHKRVHGVKGANPELTDFAPKMHSLPLYSKHSGSGCVILFATSVYLVWRCISTQKYSINSFDLKIITLALEAVKTKRQLRIHSKTQQNNGRINGPESHQSIWYGDASPHINTQQTALI